MASPYGGSSSPRMHNSVPDPRSSRYDAASPDQGSGPSANRPPRSTNRQSRTPTHALSEPRPRSTAPEGDSAYPSRHSQARPSPQHPSQQPSPQPQYQQPLPQQAQQQPQSQPNTRYRPPSQQILMSDSMRGSPAGGGPGGGGGGYGNGMNDFDAYSERASEIDAEHDDFYAGGGLAVEEFGQGPGQAGFRRGENDGSTSPAAASGPLLDQSHLRPGTQAALLTHERTLELYRANAKKTQDPDLQFEFAVFMVDASKTLPMPVPTPGNVMEVERAQAKKDDLVREASGLLKRLADRGHGPAQYFLADCYANGIGTTRGRQDFERAYPLFVLAAKHGHPDAAYRAGTCCENGWGCRREAAKALVFFRKAAAALHPGALYRLGIAELNGELGLSRRPKDGVQWLKRSAEHATAEFPHALHELALLHERGIDNTLFVDLEYAAELLAQAAELGYAPSAYRLGECYEYGKMGCPQDAALSIHYYNIAAQQNHRDACFALTAWYLVGSPGVLPQSDTEAYLWARRAAEQGLAKAMYALGYFLEVGIGTGVDVRESSTWYKQAADLGDRRAMQRLKGGALPPTAGAPGAIVSRDSGGPGEGGGAVGKGGKDKEKDCVIM